MNYQLSRSRSSSLRVLKTLMEQISTNLGCVLVMTSYFVTILRYEFTRNRLSARRELTVDGETV